MSLMVTLRSFFQQFYLMVGGGLVAANGLWQNTLIGIGGALFSTTAIGLANNGKVIRSQSIQQWYAQILFLPGHSSVRFDCVGI